MSADTLLIMTGIGVPLYSARGLSQTLTPSPEAKPTPMRTINGELTWIGLNVMRKYDSVITCTDQSAPAISGVWPGMAVVVACVCELPYDTSTGVANYSEVSGSSRTTTDGFTYYRPIINFMVIDLDVAFAEWQADYQWKLSLREV